MRKVCAASLVLVVLAAVLAVSAFGLPVQRPDLRTMSTTPTVPAAAVVVKTPLMLSTYRWVQPTWAVTDWVLLPTLPKTLPGAPGDQPPAWIQIS
jgi:hypothetical protein